MCGYMSLNSNQTWPVIKHARDSLRNYKQQSSREEYHYNVQNVRVCTILSSIYNKIDYKNKIILLQDLYVHT